MRLPRIFDNSLPLSRSVEGALEAFALDAAALITLPMTVPDQIKNEWCWAAVCTGVREVFENIEEDPCRLASEVLNLGCCWDPDICNQAMFLSIALDRLGYLAHPIEGQLSFKEVASQIELGRPVCCFIDYGTRIGHFIVISGIDVMSESVGILDPAPGGPHTVPQFMPLESLRAGYGMGRWRESYRTQPRI